MPFYTLSPIYLLFFPTLATVSTRPGSNQIFPKHFHHSLINRHPTRHCRLLHLAQADRVEVVLLLVLGPPATLQVRLQPLAKVHHADDGVGDRKQDQHDGDDGEGGERLAHREVELRVAGLVDAHQLEDEVGQRAEVAHHHEERAEGVLATDEEGGPDEDDNGDGDDGDGEAELEVLGLVVDHDQELHHEAEEEEEVELEQGDVDLR